jgi:light-regulated signal transduction histidine kinase (bacteriophytochrome)
MLNLKNVNMSSIVSEIIETLQLQQPERVVETIIQPDVSALCDPPLIRIVLENLIGNAWKYTGKTEHSRIEFSTIKKDNEQIYCVSDNGIGFDMKYVRNLFTPFKRLHRDPAFTGTGIGLATVHKIITRHGGSIWAQSSPDQGAHFFFTLRAFRKH